MSQSAILRGIFAAVTFLPKPLGIQVGSESALGCSDVQQRASLVSSCLSEDGNYPSPISR